jgi:thioredoxin reductase
MTISSSNHFDVGILGGGPGGMAAALSAASGEALVLIDNKMPYPYLLEATHDLPSLAGSLGNAARIIAGILPTEI